MNLAAAELRQLLYCAAEELRARQRGKPPGPQPWLRNLVRRLELEVAVSGSRSRHQTDCGEPQSDADERISARQAATMLGLSKRQVQRLAADLDGEIIDGRWLFSRTAAEDYAKGRVNGGSAA